jgi:hypothetical protein
LPSCFSYQAILCELYFRFVSVVSMLLVQVCLFFGSTQAMFDISFCLFPPSVKSLFSGFLLLPVMMLCGWTSCGIKDSTGHNLLQHNEWRTILQMYSRNAWKSNMLIASTCLLTNFPKGVGCNICCQLGWVTWVSNALHHLDLSENP